MEDREFLELIKEYIEQMEVEVEGEWRSGRDLEQLLADGEMPELYHEVLRRLDA